MAELDTQVSVDTQAAEPEVDTTAEPEAESAELARLRAEMARQKAALDKATSEAASMKKQLRAKQSAEEIAAEEKRMQDEERDRKLAEYEKRFFVAETSKKVLKFTGDESVSDTVAEYLFGAADVDGAIDAFQKAWTAREKALRLEYGKIPAPGAGGTDGPTLTKSQLDAMNFTDRVKFKRDHEEEYNKLMGR